MGLLEAFSKDDRMELTVPQFHDLMEEAIKTELILNGLEAEVSAKDLISIFAPERKPNIELRTLDDIEDGNKPISNNA